MARIAVILIIVCALGGVGYYFFSAAQNQEPICILRKPVSVVAAAEDIPAGTVIKQSHIEMESIDPTMLRDGMIANSSLAEERVTRHAIRKGDYILLGDLAPKAPSSTISTVKAPQGYLRIRNRRIVPAGGPYSIDEKDSNITEERSNVRW